MAATAFESSAAIALRKVMAVKIARPPASRLGLKLLPVQDRNETQLVYERPRVNRGVQGARGVNGPTSPAKLPGYDQFRVEPGYFGDHYLINEQSLIERRTIGDWMRFDSTGEQTGKASDLLTQRYYDRVELNIFTMLLTGSLVVSAIGGQVVYQDIYPILKFTASPLFSDAANSAPLAFLRSTLATLETGVSVDFRGGTLLMSRNTLNLILANTNAADIGGKRFEVGQTLNSVAELNDLLLANDLPTVELYDEGYFPEPEGTAFVKFLPLGKIILLGKRTDGEQIGEYTQTRAAQNPNSGPGMWLAVRDERDRAPARIIIECGHNGGPRIFYPEAVAVLTVA